MTPPDERQAGLRAAATALCNFAGRHLAGDSDVLPEDVYAAIEEVRAALAVAQVPAPRCDFDCDACRADDPVTPRRSHVSP